jgi:uncharacterized protein YjiS (DUF1127 family)
LSAKKRLLEPRQWVSWLSIGLTLSLVLLPPEARAAFLSSKAALVIDSSDPDRQQNLGRIQQVLESKVIAQRLSDLGLTQSQIMERLGQMSDEQIRQTAAQLDSALMPGGDALGTVLILVVIAILVVLLFQMTGHKIIVTK